MSPGGSAPPTAPASTARNLTAACVAIGLLYAAIFVVPPLISPIFVGRLHESHAQAGLLMTGYAAAYALLSFPAGVLGDRVGAGRLVGGGLALAAASSLALPLSGDFAWLLVLRVLMGVAAALAYAPAIALVRHAAPAERVHGAIGTFMAALTVGIAAIYFLAPHLNAWVGWRWTFRIVGLACLVGLAIFAALRPAAGDRGGERAPLRPGVAMLVRDRGLLAVSLSLTLAFFVLYGVLTWMPPFLSDVSHFGSGEIGNVSLFIALAQIPAALLAGAACARLRAPVAVTGVSLALAAVIFAIGIADARDVVAVTALAVTSAFGGTAAITVLFALPAATTEPALGGTATGIATTIGMAGAIGATYLGGVAVGGWSYAAWFAAVALAAIAVLVPVALTLRRASAGAPAHEPGPLAVPSAMP